MFSFQSVHAAYMQCRRHKRNTLNALAFEHNLIENLWDLTHDLQSKRYRIGPSLVFLTHSPKLREVFAADFRDRVVHHVLVKVLEPIFERRFIHDVYNNRRGKGTHAAILRAQRFMRQTRGGYYLQLDIKGFFYHLNKQILMEKIKEGVLKALSSVTDDNANKFASPKTTHQTTCTQGAAISIAESHATKVATPKEAILPPSAIPDILWLAHTIVFHDPTRDYRLRGSQHQLEKLPPHKSLFKLPRHLGLPIGNLTSQFFANVYLNDFDNYLKRTLKVRRYIRYVDDFVLFDEDPGRLTVLREQIAEYLHRELGLSLREDSRLRAHTQGLDFLGYIIRPDYILVRRRVVNNFKRKKARYLERYENYYRGSASHDMSRSDVFFNGAATSVAENDANQFASPNTTKQAPPPEVILAEIKHFLSVRASFAGHIQHANSYNLSQKTGALDETDPFEYDRA
jgi:retron-type reverse transcriptase